MKVIGINGSARKDGNTSLLIKAVFAELEAEGIETDLVQLHGKALEPCKACFGCGGKRQCVVKTDYFNECFAKMVEADGIVLGSPVYSADVTAGMKAFLERAGVVVATNPGMLRHKVGASVAAVRRGGPGRRGHDEPFPSE
ncbi:flavodoxin family protein [Bilophila wadsworthia]|uniref:flavodoxin family protein n=1 Tax=Bilophila wadsworthia TaxID=35833 RepID=UPI0034A012E2